MNNLIAMTSEITMGTREIAEMLGKNHSDIKRSAERLSSAGILTQPMAESPFEHKGNQGVKEGRLRAGLGGFVDTHTPTSPPPVPVGR